MESRYSIHVYSGEDHVGCVDPGGSTDEPGMYCMFGWGEPIVKIDLDKINKYDENFFITVAQAAGEGLTFSLYRHILEGVRTVELIYEGEIDPDTEKIRTYLIEK